MPKIIFTSRYIKGGAHGGNLVNYMATRDGVTMPYVINGTRPATQNQQRLINEVLLSVPAAVALVSQETDGSYCISGNAIDRQPENGGNGLGCQKESSYTLTATDHHAV